MNDIAARLDEVRARIADAAEAAGRTAEDITLVAVSKRHPPEAIEAAYAAGQRDFGENYIQELEEKRERLAERCPQARWHFIGRVQRNKAARIARTHLVHGAGKLEHLDALARHGPCRCLLQVNVGPEEQKNGLSPEEVLQPEVWQPREGLELLGLMTIPPPGQGAEGFRRLAELAATVRERHGLALPLLSMGMTSDFEAAIAEGATHVRIGTAIFGSRSG